MELFFQIVLVYTGLWSLYFLVPKSFRDPHGKYTLNPPRYTTHSNELTLWQKTIVTILFAFFLVGVGFIVDSFGF